MHASYEPDRPSTPVSVALRGEPAPRV